MNASLPTTRRPSIRDVARAAKVSHTTVSLILNGKMAGTSDTRERVLNAVRDLDYRPDALFRKAVAERQRTNRGNGMHAKARTNILALVLPPRMHRSMENNDGYYSGVFSGVCQAATEAGYHILLCPVEEEEPTSVPAIIQDGKVDGILVEGTFPAEWIGMLARLLPTALVNVSHPGLDTICVTANWERVGYKLIQYGWEMGHRNIVLFRHDLPSENLSAVTRGHFKALEALGGTLIHPELSRPLPLRPERTRPLIEAFVDEWQAAVPRPTLIVTTDAYASDIASVLAARGLSIPGDVSLLGRHGNHLSNPDCPPLTTFIYPVREIGHTATRLLLEAISRDRMEPLHVMLDGQLVERTSVRRI